MRVWIKIFKQIVVKKVRRFSPEKVIQTIFLHLLVLTPFCNFKCRTVVLFIHIRCLTAIDHEKFCFSEL